MIAPARLGSRSLRSCDSHPPRTAFRELARSAFHPANILATSASDAAAPSSIASTPRSDSHCRRLEWATRARRDRKSTRLNSSHVEISYAVFCLKKKKQNNKIHKKKRTR